MRKKSIDILKVIKSSYVVVYGATINKVFKLKNYLPLNIKGESQTKMVKQ